MINDQTWRSSDISSAEDQKPAQPVAGSWRRLTSSNAISWSSAPLGVSAAGSDVWAFLARSPGWPWVEATSLLSPEGSCPRVTGGLAHASALLILQDEARWTYLGTSRADLVRFAIRDAYCTCMKRLVEVLQIKVFRYSLSHDYLFSKPFCLLLHYKWK